MLKEARSRANGKSNGSKSVPVAEHSGWLAMYMSESEREKDAGNMSDWVPPNKP